jgi:autotransporter passenger strand-loop-strand repeat protein
MSEELLMMNSGVQTIVPEMTRASAPQQIIFLDFDGAQTSYNGDNATIENVTIQNSFYSTSEITIIIDALNELFDDDVLFVSEAPENGDYSTIFIGETYSFIVPLGLSASNSIIAITETIDTGNQKHNDNAFVMLGYGASLELVTSAIEFEARQLVEGLDHDVNVAKKRHELYFGDLVSNSNETLRIQSVDSAVESYTTGTQILFDSGNEEWRFTDGTVIENLIVKNGATLKILNENDSNIHKINNVTVEGYRTRFYVNNIDEIDELVIGIPYERFNNMIWEYRIGFEYLYCTISNCSNISKLQILNLTSLAVSKANNIINTSVCSGGSAQITDTQHIENLKVFKDGKATITTYSCDCVVKDITINGICSIETHDNYTIQLEDDIIIKKGGSLDFKRWGYLKDGELKGGTIVDASKAEINFEILNLSGKEKNPLLTTDKCIPKEIINVNTGESTYGYFYSTTSLSDVLNCNNFSVTASLHQPLGEYRLINTTSFTGTISVKGINGNVWGNLSIGQSFVHGNRTYKLLLINQNVTLSIIDGYELTDVCFDQEPKLSYKRHGEACNSFGMNDKIYLSFAAKNISDTATGKFSYTVFIDDIEYKTYTMSIDARTTAKPTEIILSASDIKQCLRYNDVHQLVGDHTIRVVLDSKDKLEEISEENNEATASFAFMSSVPDEVLEYLSFLAYNDITQNSIYGYEVTEGGSVYWFKVDQVFYDSESGFWAAGLKQCDNSGNIYEYNGNAILVCRGTNEIFEPRITINPMMIIDPGITRFGVKFIGKDILSDLAPQGIGYNQFSTSFATTEAQIWLNESRNEGYSLSITGHSLGGALAQMFASTTADIDQLVTFNSPGVGKSFSDCKANKVTHYVNSGDLVSMAGRNYVGSTNSMENVYLVYNPDCWGSGPIDYLIYKHITERLLATKKDIRQLSLEELASDNFSYMATPETFDASYARFCLMLSGGFVGVASLIAKRFSTENSRVFIGALLEVCERYKITRKFIPEKYRMIIESIAVAAGGVAGEVAAGAITAHYIVNDLYNLWCKAWNGTTPTLLGTGDLVSTDGSSYGKSIRALDLDGDLVPDVLYNFTDQEFESVARVNQVKYMVVNGKLTTSLDAKQGWICFCLDDISFGGYNIILPASGIGPMQGIYRIDSQDVEKIEVNSQNIFIGRDGKRYVLDDPGTTYSIDIERDASVTVGEAVLFVSKQNVTWDDSDFSILLADTDANLLAGGENDVVEIRITTDNHPEGVYVFLEETEIEGIFSGGFSFDCHLENYIGFDLDCGETVSIRYIDANDGNGKQKIISSEAVSHANEVFLELDDILDADYNGTYEKLDWTDFHIDITGELQTGRYRIAKDVSSYSRKVFLFSTEDAFLYSLAVNDTIVTPLASFSLSLDGNALWLDVNVEGANADLDTTPPDAPVVRSLPMVPTNQNVTIYADFAEDSVLNQYSLDYSSTYEIVDGRYELTESGTWFEYGDGVTLEQSGMVYFRSMDVAGNYSDVAEAYVSAIDKEAPEKPTFTADVIGHALGYVTITVDYDEETVYGEYSIDGGGWEEYTGSIVVGEVCTIAARSRDAAGNVSETAYYRIAGWRDMVIINNHGDSTQQYSLDSRRILDNEDIYVNFYISNRDNLENTDYSAVIFVDDELYADYDFPSLGYEENAGKININIGKLTAGSHTVVLRKEEKNSEGEVVNVENMVTKSFNVLSHEEAISDEFIIGAAQELSQLSLVGGEIESKIIVSSGGLLTVADGATVTDAIIEYGGSQVIYEGGIAQDTILQNMGSRNDYNVINCVGGQYISSGGTAINTVLYNAEAIIKSGGTGIGYICEGDEQDYLQVEAGGVLNSCSIGSRSRLILEDGAYISGVLSVAGSAYILTGEPVLPSDAQELQVVFDLSELASNLSDPRISHFEKFKGASFSILCREGAVGYYCLAKYYDGNFDGSITIKSSEDEILGKLSLNESIWVRGVSYELYQKGQYLMFYISGNNGDTTSPGITITSHQNNWTNGDVTVTANFTDNVAIKNRQYKINDGRWQHYETGVTMTENGTVYFQATDTSGNKTETSYVVSNIDKNAPVIQNISPNIVTTTNSNVRVTADFTDESGLASRLYRIDDTEWQNYDDGVPMDQNGVITFKAIDRAGNETEEQYQVNNIDKTAPVVTQLAFTERKITKEDIKVFAVYSDDVAIKSRQYRINDGQWLDYSDAGFTISANCELTFKAEDTAGNISERHYTVTNIDKIVPEITQISADIVEETESPVRVTAIFSDDVEVAAKQFRIDGGDWQDYVDGAVMTTNGTVEFLVTDTAGNSATASYTVSNILNTMGLQAEADITAMTNHNVKVTLIVPEDVDVATMEFRRDDGDWQAYSGSVEMEQNGTVHFKVVDSDGNEGKTQYEVTNIDKIAPEITQISADVTNPTNRDVKVTAVFGDNVAVTVRQFQIDGGEWQDYENVALVQSNGTVKFRAEDEAGNTATASFTVANIDKEAPEITQISADITSPTNTNVKVTAVFDDNTTLVKKQFRKNDSDWQDYVDGVEMTANGIVYFIAEDAAENITEASYVVSNIDKVKPMITQITANTTEETESPVTLTAVFSDDVSIDKKQFRTNGGAWQDYVDSAVIRTNGTVEFLAVDSAGNSATASYNVSNIVANNRIIISSGETDIGRTVSQEQIVEVYGTMVSAVDYGEVEVYEGGYISSTTINSKGVLRILNNASVDDIDINSKGSVYLDGGYANNVTVKSSGYLRVSNGGTANDTTVNAHGYLLVYSGGIANSATVNESGYLGVVESGGIAISTTINANGQIRIANGGMASNTTVKSGGSIYVLKGGSALQIMEDGGYVYIEDNTEVTFVPNTLSNFIISSSIATLHSGTTAISTTINDGSLRIYRDGMADTIVNVSGFIQVNSGGTALRIKEAGGYVRIEDGAEVTFAPNIFSNVIVSTLRATLHSGTTAVSITVNPYGDLFIYNGGSANGTIVSAYGSVYVSQGGVANSTMVFNIGCMYVSHCGVVNGAIVSGGTIYISSGGTASDMTVSDHGHVSNIGGIINKTTVSSDGIVFIHSCGVANETNVSSRGYVYIYNGGIASETNVSSGGTVYVEDNGVLNETIISSGGHVYVSCGGMANGTIVSGGYAHIFSGGIADGTIVSGGDVDVFGTISNTNVLRGVIGVESGGIAIGTKINGYISIHNGGIVKETTISSGGSVNVYSGGMANQTTISSGGRVVVHSGGTANDTIVSGGYLGVSRGGAAMTIMEAGGYVYIADGAEATFTPNCFSDIVLSNGSATLHSGTTAVSTILNSRGRLEVCSGGVASGTIVNSFGCVFVENGGIVNGMTINSGGSLCIYDGGIVNGMTVNSGGSLHVCDDGKVLEIVENGGFISIENGAVATFTPNCFSGIVLFNGSATLHSGTTAVATLVSRGGFLFVYSGGVADQTTVTMGYGGYFCVFEGGIANETIAIQGGMLNVSSGGTIIQTTVSSGGKVIINSGGIAKQTTIMSGGNFNCWNGGSMIQTTVSSGGSLIIYSGCITNNMTVSSGGSMITSNGAVLHGRVSLGGSAIMSGTVDASSAHVTFDVSERTTSATVILNDIALLNAMDYSISVAAAQEAGQYKLAGNASDFNETVKLTVKDTDLTADLTKGVTAAVNGKDYTLDTVNGELCLTITATVVPTPADPIVLDDKVSWTAAEGASGYVVEYSLDNFATVVTVETETVGMEHVNLPEGTWQWRVRAKEGTEWAVGEEIVVSSGGTAEGPSVVSAVDDGVADVFFARSVGVFGNGQLKAAHSGIKDGWNGTGERALVSGRNRFGDVFAGSNDATTLLLTDDEGGDALFADDVITESPDGVAEQQARLSRLDAIFAGAGNDIVDLTSDQFDYVGGGLSVHGGLGDDTIWSNAGNNTLFGDAGNDRIVGAGGNDVIVGGSGNDSMHGGGGEDIFAFGGNWGKDTVEQLADGRVTLWFDSGSAAKWNASTLTYTDGDKSVQVSGVTASAVTLKFGDDGSAQYDKLLEIGAFDEFSSGRIFENKNTRGMLA